MNVLPQNFEQQLRDKVLRKIETLDPEQCKDLLKYLVKTTILLGLQVPSRLEIILILKSYLFWKDIFVE